MKIGTLLFTLVVLAQLSFAQSRQVAVLDMTNYNSETGASRQLSAERLIKLIGVPYLLTDSLELAMQHPIILTGSRIMDGAFSAGQIADLKNWVTAGGTIITSSLREPDLFDVFGIDSSTSSNALFEITFDTTSASVFNYIDDSLEVTIPLGDPVQVTTFYSKYYSLTTGTSLASFENNECALVKNSFGSGTAYAFGPDFRDVTFRNQFNADVNANRTYSNGFEPSSDVIMLLVRNMINEHLPNPIYSHTIPNKGRSVVLITHDIDSQTAVDTMLDFAIYEQSIYAIGQYNATTRYLGDSLMSDFYIGSQSKYNQVLAMGHVVASHSVGHFPDFSNQSLFPFGSLGNTTTNYLPFNNGSYTAGASILGELEVSKNLIESDLNTTVKSFRAGHLVYPDSLILGLETMGYSFNSTYSANDILTSFPFYALKTPSFSALESSIIEIPMTISDVFHADPINASNYSQKVAIWTDATVKYAANNSPVVLLIHPNRMYKLAAQQDYINSLATDVLVYSFEGYGEFWKKRDALSYTSAISGNDMTVTINDANLIGQQSFVIDFNGLDTVIFKNQLGASIDFDWMPWTYNTRLYFQENGSAGFNQTDHSSLIQIYPNPSTGLVNIAGYQGEFELIDLSGKICAAGSVQEGQAIDVSQMTAGIYLLKLGEVMKKLVIE